MLRFTSVKLVATLLAVTFLTACGQDVFKPLQAPGARTNERSPVYHELKDLPKPIEPVVVAVYKFRDQTGQYKPTETGSSFSTAVTQGATNILIKALDDSGYFTPIERENVSNLLNERKIIRSTRTQYGNPEGQNAAVLPPLLYAGIIIEGGIVSYDANVLTGGAGARYFGAGANTRYREDRVTIYLRAISTSNGRILKTVNTSRTILSQALDGGLFRFVKFQRLLEAELGYTYNEPSEMAVREAIEKAVQVLVLDGLAEGLWASADTTGRIQTQLQELRDQESTFQERDLHSQFGLDPRPPVMAGPMAQVIKFSGDVPEGRYEYGGGISLGYRFTPRYGLSVRGAFGTLSTIDLLYQQDVLNLNATIDFRPVPDYRLVPVLQVGLGATLLTEASEARPGTDEVAANLYYGGGLEYRLGKRAELFGSVGNLYHFSDRLDGQKQGKFNDWYLAGQVGIHFLLGKTSTSSDN